MSESRFTLHAPRIRLWRYLPILIILGLAVHLLLPQIADLTKSWSIIQQMPWWAVSLAILAQILSYVGSAFMLQAILANGQGQLSLSRGLLITLASNSIGLVAGGWVGSAAATYGWIRREGHPGNSAALAGTLPPLLNNAILAVVSLIGVIYLLLNHDLSRTQLVGFSIVLLLLCVLAGIIAVAWRNPQGTTQILGVLSARWARIRHEASEPKDTESSIYQFFQAERSLGGGRWVRPVLGATANTLFDMLTLYFMFIAAGHAVSPGVLFSGYGLPFMLGKLAFIIPGGVGVIETGMVAIYSSLGVPNDVGVVVILGYRLISFWTPSLLGFAAAAYLGTKNKLPQAAN